jgi:tRNA nucleotidyltransferase/poly(A) polymerase
MYYAWLISEFALDPDQEFIKEVSASSVNFRAMSPAMRTYFLFAILAGQRPSRGLIFLLQSGLMKDVFRSLQYLAGVDQRNAHGHKDIFYHTCEVVDNVARAAQNVWLRFSALVHDIAKPKTKKYSEETGWSFHGHEELGARWMDRIFQQLELPPWKLDYVKKMIRLHLRPSALASEEVTDSAIRRLQTEAGGDLQDLMILCRADITSKNYSKVSRFLKNYDYVEERLLDVRQKDELAAFQSPVRGEEIMRICGLKPSRAVGILKETIEEAILSGHIPNTYEAALEYLYQIKDKILADIRIKL